MGLSSVGVGLRCLRSLRRLLGLFLAPIHLCGSTGSVHQLNLTPDDPIIRKQKRGIDVRLRDRMRLEEVTRGRRHCVILDYVALVKQRFKRSAKCAKQFRVIIRRRDEIVAYQVIVLGFPRRRPRNRILDGNSVCLRLLDKARGHTTAIKRILGQHGTHRNIEHIAQIQIDSTGYLLAILRKLQRLLRKKRIQIDRKLTRVLELLRIQNALQ